MDRTVLDGILETIGATSLTDEEYESADEAIEDEDDQVQIYEALDAVLFGREAISTTRDRLVAYFAARGVEVAKEEKENSEIFIGSVLE